MGDVTVDEMRVWFSLLSFPLAGIVACFAWFLLTTDATYVSERVEELATGGAICDDMFGRSRSFDEREKFIRNVDDLWWLRDCLWDTDPLRFGGKTPRSSFAR